MLLAVGFIAAGLAPIGAIRGDSGLLAAAVSLFFSPALIGAGVGALFHRKWLGFQFGLALTFGVLVPGSLKAFFS